MRSRPRLRPDPALLSGLHAECLGLRLQSCLMASYLPDLQLVTVRVPRGEQRNPFVSCEGAQAAAPSVPWEVRGRCPGPHRGATVLPGQVGSSVCCAQPQGTADQPLGGGVLASWEPRSLGLPYLVASCSWAPESLYRSHIYSFTIQLGRAPDSGYGIQQSSSCVWSSAAGGKRQGAGDLCSGQ